ncbi:hypothetical protein Phum_PHUM216680 [Pediculus humanus corporis]|uniref:Uncharacterized protein n=1 Tax=Pediculus humanus subsp. corporis TaxID=121224 RepID=E0VHV5_PEDHC|nr:uncharacterized protein Phum_PHUM216680 [Pediculus humanus corporis]EEB12961.1 hypothetical protein Phum_PHUM216680 [Pediculus humanus corporis]
MTAPLIKMIIDLGGINLNRLKNLKELNLFNTTTCSLKRKLFSDVPNLKKLVIQNNVHLKMAEYSFLKYSRLKILTINGIHLNPNESNTFFKNLTGDVIISYISVLDWSYNNFGNLKKEILTNFRRVDTLALKHSNIKNVDDNIFHHLNIKYLHLEGALLMVIFSKNKPKGIISKNEERMKLENLSDKSRELSLNKNCSDKPLSMNLRFSYPKHSKSSESFETLSTVSYVSANQPNQMELLNYKLNKLRETFQKTNGIISTSYLPVIISSPTTKSPLNVDLLLEYECLTALLKCEKLSILVDILKNFPRYMGFL